MLYSNPNLEAMLTDLESDLVERKETFGGDAPTAGREAVCAFANDLPDHRQAGVLFIGARDDGSPSGAAITDELLRNLADEGLSVLMISSELEELIAAADHVTVLSDGVSVARIAAGDLSEEALMTAMAHQEGEAA